MISQNITHLLFFHEEILMRAFLIEITEKNTTKKLLTETDLIQYNLIRKDEYNVTLLAHQYLIQKLLDFAFEEFLYTPNTFFKIYDFDFLPNCVIDFDFLYAIHKNDFAELLETLHLNFLNSEFSYQNAAVPDMEK